MQLSGRNPDAGSETAERALLEADIAAMAAGDIPRDREAEAGAALIEVARRIQPVEWAEHCLVLRGRDARAVVVDGDGQPAAFVQAGQFDAVAVADGVADQIGEAAHQR